MIIPQYCNLRDIVIVNLQMNNSDSISDDKSCPTFMDLFGSQLISNLIGIETFQSKLSSLSSKDGKRVIDDSNRLYWRTKVVPMSTSEYSPSGHVFFLDVSVEFNMKKRNDDDLPKVQTRLGALVNRYKQNNIRDQFCDDTMIDDHDDDCNHCIHYIQTNIVTKETLEKYANDIQIDMTATGPTEIANIISNALLCYNHSNFTKKCDIPPALELHTVCILDHLDNDKKKKGIIQKDRIAIFHLDLMEKGYIHFPYQDRLGRNKSYIGKYAFEMIMKNYSLCDDKIMNQPIITPDNRARSHNKTTEIFNRWWSQQYNQNDIIDNEDKSSGENNIEGKKQFANSSSMPSNCIETTTSNNEKELFRKRKVVMNGHAMLCSSIRPKKNKKGKMTIGKMK